MKLVPAQLVGEAAGGEGHDHQHPGDSHGHDQGGIEKRLDNDVVQFHSADYRSPERVPHGPVLVVGSTSGAKSSTSAA